ncbi:MAG: hypothetical protein [Circular genetic element sp.]|nr:MAG: hypothetical protein [Circular genetic element sp.]
MEGQLYYPISNTGNQNHFVNLCRDLSILNAKNVEHTSRDGHVKGYMVNVTLIGASEQLYLFGTAPNSWKFRNSFRKWHAYRDLMFANAGVTRDELGRYGQTIRPYLNEDHYDTEAGTSSNAIAKPHNGLGLIFEGGEWSYSKFGVVPSYTVDPVTGVSTKMQDSKLQIADEFAVTILDDNSFDPLGNEANSSGTYKTCGMIHSYNLDRMEVVTPSADTIIEGPENPLSQLISSGNQAVGVVVDVAGEQELEEPPYDLSDDGDSIELITAAVARIPTTLSITRTTMFVPAGLLRVRCEGTGNFKMMIDVVGEVLCKDMA